MEVTKTCFKICVGLSVIRSSHPSAFHPEAFTFALSPVRSCEPQRQPNLPHLPLWSEVGCDEGETSLPLNLHHQYLMLHPS